ncbi:MAG: RNA polymerase sigma factor, partial [Acidobacteriota bacterium]
MTNGTSGDGASDRDASKNVSIEASDLRIDRLFDRFGDEIRKYFRLRGAGASSEDLTQETFYRAARHAETFRGETAPRGWLFAIASNVWKNHLRSRSAAKRAGGTAPLSDEANEEGLVLADRQDLEATLLERERRDLLRQAIEELPDRMRQIVELRIVQERSYREIATLLQLRESTVKTDLRLAKTKLRVRLA